MRIVGMMEESELRGLLNEVAEEDLKTFFLNVHLFSDAAEHSESESVSKVP